MGNFTGRICAIACALHALACATPKAPTPEPGIRQVPSSASSASEVTIPEASASAAPTGTPPMVEASAPPARLWPESNKRIPLDVAGGKAEAWAPVNPPANGSAPVSVYFHGITANAQLECPVTWGAMQSGWMVCADGNIPLGGGFTWNSPGSKTRVEAAISALTVKHKDLVSEQRGVIIGYSIGAMAAWYLLEHSAEPWIGLVFINAEFGVIPRVVKDKGLKRVAMIAARGDMTSGQMAATTRSLVRQGIDARFFTFESKNGHFFDDETYQRLMVPLVWALTGE